MNNSISVLIPCAIYPGMFPNEYAVEIELRSGKKISLFADESDLEEIDLTNGQALLKVEFISNQPDVKREVLVYLPKESLETGNRWFEVPREKVIH